MKYICQYCGKEYDSKIGKSVHELYCDLNPNKSILHCQYCGKECKPPLGLKNHEYSCKDNPNKKEKKINTTYTCQYCGKVFNNGGAYKKHIKVCQLNPNPIKNQYNKHINDISEVTCQYCGKVFKSKSNKTQHEVICKLNPNRIARTLCQKYDMMSDEELINEAKKYKTRKETPGQLISICHSRNLYLWKYKGPYANLSNEELLNEVNKYQIKRDIPYTLNQELKRRNIDLPEKFNVLSLTEKLRLLSNKELINILNKFNDKKECLCNKEGAIAFNLLKKERNNTEHSFFRNKTFNKFHYYSDQQLIDIVNQYLSKKELYDNGYYYVVYEISKRHIKENKLPNWYTEKPINYEEKTDEELISLVSNIKNRKELEQLGLIKVWNELKRRNLEIYKRFTKNYHPEYETMTDDELLNIVNTEYKDKNIKYVVDKNRPLINQLRKRNIQYLAFPNSDKSYYGIEYGIKLSKEKWGDKFDYSKVNETYKNWKSLIKIGCPIHGFFETTFGAHLGYKYDGCPICSTNIKINNDGGYSRDERFRMLTKYDLESMSWTVILDLIGIDKLPSEFNKLCKYGENTPERKKMIQDLIDSYNIEVSENDTDEENNDDLINNDNIETEVNNITDEDTNIYDDEDNDLNPFKENKTIGELLGDVDEQFFSTGDKFIHLFNKSMHQLWNRVLRDNENHNENTINEIHQKLINDSLTKYEKYIYEEFLKEYDEVINLEIH